MDNQFPFNFGKYRMEAEIGRGGFGTVFRAVDLDLDRPVAIKIMDPIYMRDQRWVSRFRREARVMARLDHPHIVTVHEIGEESGRLFIAMKFVDGPDLTRYIRDNGPLPWETVLKLSKQIASALDFAHQQNVVHRDLKPGNILISDDNAMLTDFGLAQMMESNSQSVSVSGGFAGTYNYMPPEIFNNEPPTAAADVYALGCVVYEMITGKVLIEGDSTAAIIGNLLKGVTLDHPLSEEMPPGVNEVIQTALAKDPQERYPSAGEMAADLERVATDRLAAPYATLQEALDESDWAAAVSLAAEISAQDPNYRDIAALEAQAKRGQWSQQWRAEAQRGLDSEDYDLVRGALIQWRRVDPQHPDIEKIEKEMALAEDYAALQALIDQGKWQEAKTAAAAIAVQDAGYRDLTTLQARINTRLASAEPDSATEEGKPVRRSTAIEADPARPTPPPRKDKEEKRRFPVWAWIAAIPLVACMLLFFFVLYSFTRPQVVEQVPPFVEEEATPVIEEEFDPPAVAPGAGVAEAENTPVVEEVVTPFVEAQQGPLPFEGRTLTIWADEVRAPVLSRLAGDFHAQSGADVVVEEYGFADLQDRFIADVISGGGPDLIAGPHDWVGTFWHSDLIAPIDIGGLFSEFHEGALEAFTYTDGQLYGLPYSVESVAFCFNTNFINVAPETWSGVMEIGEEFVQSGNLNVSQQSVQSGQDSYALSLPARIYHPYAIHTAYGGYIFGENKDGGYDVSDVGLDSIGFIESAYWLLEMSSRGLLVPNFTAEEALTSFENNEALFLITGPWNLNRLLESGVSFQCGFFPDFGRPFLGAQGFMLNVNSPNHDLAHAFLNEFVAAEGPMALLADASERPSAFLPVFHNIQESDPMYGFAQASLDAVPIPANPEMNLVWGPWDEAMIAILSFQLTPEEALGTAAKHIRDQIESDGFTK